MKKILLGLAICFIYTCGAQTYHIEYSSDKLSTPCLNVSNNRIYLGYIEFPCSNITCSVSNFILQKNDLMGNIIWRKEYVSSQNLGGYKLVGIKNFNGSIIAGLSNSSATITTDKCIFLSIDTLSGIVNFATAASAGPPSDNLILEEFTIINNEIITVGRLNNSTTGNRFAYIKMNANTGNLISGYYGVSSNSMITNGVSFYNGSLYVVGTNSNVPYIAKLQHAPSLSFVAAKTFSSIPSSFNNIAVNNSGIITITSGSGTFAGFLIKADTNITASSYSLSGLTYSGSPGNNLAFLSLTTNGNKFCVTSRDGSNKNAIQTFVDPVTYAPPITYTAPSPNPLWWFGSNGNCEAHLYNNNTYFLNSKSGSFMTYSPNIIRGDSVGKTTCSSTITIPTSTFISNGINFVNSVTLAGSQIALTTTVNTLLTNSVYVCGPIITTNINYNEKIEFGYILLKTTYGYIIKSENEKIKESALFDLMGKKLSSSIVRKNENEIEVNLENLSENLYFLKLYYEKDATKTIKLIK